MKRGRDWPAETEAIEWRFGWQVLSRAVAQKSVYIGPHGIVWYKYTGGEIYQDDEHPWIGWHSENDGTSVEGQGFNGLWYTYGSKAIDLIGITPAVTIGLELSAARLRSCRHICLTPAGRLFAPKFPLSCSVPPATSSFICKWTAVDVS